MGCSPSKLDNEALLQLCKDRNKFIKQAVEHRMEFASGHIAYIQSMKRVSAALREYIIGHESCDNMLDSFTQDDCSPIKKKSADFVCISPRSFSVAPAKSEPNSCCKINYLKSGGNPSVSVEVRPPQSPETVRVEAYAPVHHFEMGSILEMHSSSVSSSIFHSSPNNRPNCSPISAQTSQWDFFWNPFTSLDYYGYPTSSLGENILNDENARARQVREEESISESEEKKEKKEIDERINKKEERVKADENSKREEVAAEDVDDSVNNKNEDGTISEPRTEQNIEVVKCENVGQISGKGTAVIDCESKEETPGYTVYINQRLTSMAEVVKDLEGQFMIAHNSATDVSLILQAGKAKYSSTSNDLTVMEMLNPVALFRSASSRSSSLSRVLVSSSTSRDEDYKCSSNFSEESCTFTGNHQSTLEKLYAWEKKLYQEVRAGERIRKAYEKKCAQLRNQDVKGKEPPLSEKTRASLTDLHTQIKVSIHLVESASKRIETLRDEELEPQILELVQGLARMWKVMAECHQLQKCTLDEAKILLAETLSTYSATKKQTMLPSKLQRLANSAANLETELRNWRACFGTWIVSQRSYVHALTGWLLHCVRLDPNTSKLPFAPRESFGGLSMFNICIQWSRFLDAIQEAPVLGGLDLAAEGVCSLYAQQLQEDSCRKISASKSCGGEQEPVGVVEVGRFEDEVVNAEKIAEVANRVLCAGMSVAMNSLTEFASISAEGYANLVKQWENAKQPKSSDIEN
ncbi:unnamed protein product [Fraxinus pennsylvanica]|uniref:DUF632 domain-containing protein n=1 Tax=Fraxinus pennsylvanica TaxID=56036 RepID=A0AAD1Z105_9LAMI|nr:unnamed protein product [Fraxinus pennsylvanica]